MLYTPSIENTQMFDTLSFSKNMQKAGMSEQIANELAYNLRDMNVNHFESLLTKAEFQKFEKEIRTEIENIHEEFGEFKREVRQDIQEIRVEFKQEIEKMVTKDEFNAKIKNLELSITVKMGIIMTTGIGALGLLIKL